jgi:hypothetical protein
MVAFPQRFVTGVAMGEADENSPDRMILSGGSSRTITRTRLLVRHSWRSSLPLC